MPPQSTSLSPLSSSPLVQLEHTPSRHVPPSPHAVPSGSWSMEQSPSLQLRFAQGLSRPGHSSRVVQPSRGAPSPAASLPSASADASGCFDGVGLLVSVSGNRHAPNMPAAKADSTRAKHKRSAAREGGKSGADQLIA